MKKEILNFEKDRKIALLIIDVQAKIINPIEDKNYIINNIKKLLKAYEILEENIFLSEQNPSKLGNTINDLLPKGNFKRIEKMTFSVAYDKNLQNEISLKEIKSIIICGFETHICVQQSVLDLLEQNINVFIIADAMSSRKKVDHDISINRMVSKGANLASTESMIFELCQTASRKDFKEISNIIKNN